uniref:Uncharacterized protein n=1 Tax=Picea glauca TaxID=3330 RepID=A0A101M525_PICGL|nr:hypothetical protein ABT39_MTgene991 [Picea glauca]QHR90894.1 hypothetical protein Q903MT_gene4921 [Picea sitchensis]
MVSTMPNQFSSRIEIFSQLCEICGWEINNSPAETNRSPDDRKVRVRMGEHPPPSRSPCCPMTRPNRSERPYLIYIFAEYVSWVSEFH